MMTRTSSVHAIDYVDPTVLSSIQDCLMDSFSLAFDRHRLDKTIEALTAGLLKAQLLTPAQALQALTDVGCVTELFERRFQELLAQVIYILQPCKEQGGGALFKHCPDSKAKKQCKLCYTLILPEEGTKAGQASHVEVGLMCVGHTIKIKPEAQADASSSDTQAQVECAFLLPKLNWNNNKSAAMPVRQYANSGALLRWIAGGQ